MNPIISLIICTKNRADQLAECLTHVLNIKSNLPWEVILVDNNSTDNTASIISTFIENFPGIARSVFESRPGNGVGRNTGIVLAKGEILAFTDDDCYVTPDFIDQISDIFSDASVGYASGRVLLHDPDDAKITINESSVPDPFPASACLPVGLIQGANMAFRRSALEQSGLFDPLFGAGAQFAGEDWELAIRVSYCGWTGGYFPGPTVAHHHRRKSQDVPKLLRFYAIGEGAVYAKLILCGPLRFKTLKLLLREIHSAIVNDHNVKRTAFMLKGAAQYVARRLARSGAQS